MREPLEIIIRKDGLLLCHPTDYSVTEFVGREEKGISGRIAGFVLRTSASKSTVHLFVTEDLLFFKRLQMPLEISDLNEAMGYQLEMATPFSDEPTWYSYKAVKGDDAYHITLYATQSAYVDGYVQEIMEGGLHLSGVYPESQRFVNKLNRKSDWAILIPGRFGKACIFRGAVMEDRWLCSSEPNFPEAVDVCRADTVFKYEMEAEGTPPAQDILDRKPYFDFIDARMLISQRPLLKDYNMLPASYQRPDYLKIAIAALLVLNLVTFLALGAVKVYKLNKFNSLVNHEIEKIMPLVNEMKELRKKEEKNLKVISQMESAGKNIDLISFLTKLTNEMPTTSYVDQMRMDKQNQTIQLQGYTADVSALTAKLQNIGDTQLKSTSRRKNKTYFHVEISL